MFTDGHRPQPSGKFNVSVIAHRRRPIEEKKESGEQDAFTKQLEDRYSLAADEIASKHSKKHFTATTNMMFPSTTNKEMNNRDIAQTIDGRARGAGVFKARRRGSTHRFRYSTEELKKTY